MDRQAVVFVLKGYPRLSETFVAQEILGLEQAGLDIRIVALRHPADKRVHPVNREIAAPVSYLCEYLHDEPGRVLRALRRMVFRGGFWRALPPFCFDLARDFSRNRVRRFGQGLVLAAEMPLDAAHIHAHFIHTPASVARYASVMAGMGWSVSAHAKDIWTSPDWDLREKLASAEWAATCTKSGRDKLDTLAPAANPVALVYHGLDLDRFAPMRAPRTPRDGRDADHPVQVLTVGRAVEKKGLGDVLAALALLPPATHWRWTHIGGGELLPALKAQAEALGLAGRVEWLGAQDQERVLAAYRQSDIFALPCRIAGNGDRDGLPNVLVEAQSQGLACLSTAISAIPELILDGETGVMVPAQAESVAFQAAFAAALQKLIADPALRTRLGAAGARRVRAHFSHLGGIAQLKAMFDASLARAAR